MPIRVILLAALSGCGFTEPVPLPDVSDAPIDETRFTLVARLAHITDAHVVDEESPGRLAAVADLYASAWRPHERFSAQLLDGIIRAINAYHSQIGEIDFVLFTGDAVDNVQANELRWFLDVFDGATVDPLSGVDDRPPGERGPRLADPHRAFQPAGLYREGVHGPLRSIPWYAGLGNHDRYAVGVFPIVRLWDGRRIAPLPGANRWGLFLPLALVPDGAIAHAPITPALPGPPPDVNLPRLVAANPFRRFIEPAEMLEAYFDTVTSPRGHGFSDARHTWYSISPVAGLRLIALDTSVAAVTIPTGVYDGGAIVAEQAEFLRTELDKAQAAGEIIVLATHHPSYNLVPLLGTALTGVELQALLNAHSNVVAHLAGHTHRHRVWNRGGYLEFETGAVIDYPQEGRIIEVWRAGPKVELRYTVFSHVYEGEAFQRTNWSGPPADPFLPMRREALRIAKDHSDVFHLLPVLIHTDAPPLPALPDLFTPDLDSSIEDGHASTLGPKESNGR